MTNKEELRVYSKFSDNHDVTFREYKKVHFWLHYYFPNPTKCESATCNKKSKRYEWALKKGCKYEKKIENFLHLCRSCHSKYDTTDNTRKKMSLAKKGIKLTEAQIFNKYIPVTQYSLDGKKLRTFTSIKHACIFLGKKDYGNIGRCAKGSTKYSHAFGYKWKYSKLNTR